MRYLVLFDLDGTLLDSEGKVGKESRRIIAELVEKGNYVSVATGRPPRDIIPIYKELKMNGPVVCHTGARVFFPGNNRRREYGVTIPKKVVIDFLKYSGCLSQLNVQCESRDTLHLLVNDPYITGLSSLESDKKIEGNSLDVIPDESYIVAVAFKNMALIQNLNYSASLLKGYKTRFYASGNGAVCELWPQNVSKASGIEIARQKIQIPKCRTVFVGDGDNDVEALSLYQNSIAMINGTEKAKRAAHHISEKSNNENGAASAVLALLQGKDDFV